jgi:D-amino-acid dehydrogenase
MRVVIIGAGLAGVTTAWFLRTQGADVVVVERGSAVARETSFANGSMLTPSLADPWNAPGSFRKLLRSIGREDAAMLLRMGALPSLLGWGLRFLRSSGQKPFLDSFLANVHLARYSQEVMQQLLQGAAPGELDFDYAPDGTIKVFSSQQALQHGREIANWLQQAGISHRTLHLDALLELEPALAPGSERLVGGIHYPQDEVGNARRFCEQLYRLAADHGVDFRFSEMVLDIEREQSRISAIRTSREVLKADAFVLAAGSYSWPLGKKFGIRVPVRPAKGYSLTLPNEMPGGGPTLAVVDDALHAAVVPLREGLLRAAGTAEFAGFDARVNASRVDNLRTLLGTLYPQLNTQELQGDAWCGFRPMTTDGRPLLGVSRIPNLYLNTGHGPLGWTQACGSARALAQLITDGRSEFALENFAPARFH